ncbi:ubiquitin family domain-containing protein [Ditylenchus destructor]|uniref:Ubiquitin family domain-containing protein n=1 Tax=Ditylenchus destructor TaxID=166010 RepID=A0AAD4MV66_9BILA|nr:ubiquitin family domain-containing protein [Ditylenchus destructor]
MKSIVVFLVIFGSCLLVNVLTVETRGGPPIVLVVESSDTVGNIKTKIESKDGTLKANLQHLVYNQTELVDDSKTLGDLHITGNATMYVVAFLGRSRSVRFES